MRDHKLYPMRNLPQMGLSLWATCTSPWDDINEGSQHMNVRCTWEYLRTIKIIIFLVFHDNKSKIQDCSFSIWFERVDDTIRGKIALTTPCNLAVLQTFGLPSHVWNHRISCEIWPSFETYKHWWSQWRNWAVSKNNDIFL